MNYPLTFIRTFFLAATAIGLLLFAGGPAFANPTTPAEGMQDATLFSAQKNAAYWNRQLLAQQQKLQQRVRELENSIAQLRDENLRLNREKSFFNSKGKQLSKNQEKVLNLEALLTQTQNDLKSVTAKAKAFGKQTQIYNQEIQLRTQDKTYLLTDTVDRYETDFLEKSKLAYERTANRLSLHLAYLRKLADQQKLKTNDPLDEKTRALEQSIEQVEKEFRAASFTLQSIHGELQRRIGKKEDGLDGEVQVEDGVTPAQQQMTKSQKRFEHFRGFFREDLEKEFAQRQEKEKKNVFYLSIGSVAALLISFLFLRKAFS